jgi:hypothetical protein
MFRLTEVKFVDVDVLINCPLEGWIVTEFVVVSCLKKFMIAPSFDVVDNVIVIFPVDALTMYVSQFEFTVVVDVIDSI